MYRIEEVLCISALVGAKESAGLVGHSRNDILRRLRGSIPTYSESDV